MHSNSYTIFFTSIVTIVLGGFLSVAAGTLKETQDLNVENDSKKNILASLGFKPEGESKWSSDDITKLFKEATNNVDTSGKLDLTSSFDRFLIQARVPATGTTGEILQTTELITSIDFIDSDIVTIQKGSMETESELVDIVGNQQEDGGGLQQHHQRCQHARPPGAGARQHSQAGGQGHQLHCGADA